MSQKRAYVADPRELPLVNSHVFLYLTGLRCRHESAYVKRILATDAFFCFQRGLDISGTMNVGIHSRTERAGAS
jgi:hypothetical protein